VLFEGIKLDKESVSEKKLLFEVLLFQIDLEQKLEKKNEENNV
jgi:hypothetical protein